MHAYSQQMMEKERRRYLLGALHAPIIEHGLRPSTPVTGFGADICILAFVADEINSWLNAHNHV
ncbi:hypothetical protein BDN71DRAFT_1457743 [Pleurotus eryngii]|uniref:Uncharacterized protein n=1 Tax=Pleurotus eryngii TaxID=5323 RepID=A0A9P5ZJA4_PLEER|nr:hypothetical protein BDN71DRAFT_1457743 [Pleurotus eryngii]